MRMTSKPLPIIALDRRIPFVALHPKTVRALDRP
jgi:hypothetical protein